MLEAPKPPKAPPPAPNAGVDAPKEVEADDAPKAGVDPKEVPPKAPPCPKAGAGDPNGEAALEAPKPVEPKAGWLIPKAGVLCKLSSESQAQTSLNSRQSSALHCRWDWGHETTLRF